MAVVGSAEVLIKPVFSGMQKSIAKELGGAGESAGQQTGSGFGASLAKWGKRGAIIAGGGIAAGFGTTLVKGFKRLTAIEDAEAMLRGLGHSTEAVTGIMDSAMAAVEGTAISMDKIAPAAAQMVAAGVEPGKDLEEVLRLVGDAATIAGGDMDGMTAIFGKVAAANRLSMGEVNQIQERGIPILQLVADEMGTTQDKVREMVSAGEVDFAMFQTAMENGLGGAAQEAGSTFRGSFDNLMAYMARFGAELLSGVMPVVNTAMQGISGFLQSIEPAARVVGEVAGEHLGNAADAIQNFFTQMKSGEGVGGRFAAIIGSAFGALQSFGGWLGSNILPVLGDLWSLVSGSVVGAFQALADGWREGTGIGGGFRTIVEAIGRVIEDVRVWAEGAVSNIRSFIGEMRSGEGAGGRFRDIMSNIGSAIGGFITGLLNLTGWLIDNRVIVMTAVGAYAAFKAVMATIQFGQWVAGLYKTAAGWTRDTIATLANTKAKIASKIETIALHAMYARQWIVTQARAIAGWIRETAVMVAHRVAMVASRVAMFATVAATKAWAAAQWLLNAAMRANPIGLVIGIITALVGALVWAWNNSETFRSVVTAAWEGIKVAASVAWNWLKGIFSSISTAFTTVKNYFTSDSNVIGRTFNNLRAGFATVWNWIDQYVFKPFSAVFALLRSLFSGDSDRISKAWLMLRVALVRTWNEIVSRVTEPFKRAFAVVRDFFRDRINDIKSWWQNLKDNLRAGYQWINDRVFTPVKNAFRAVRDFFRDRVNDIKNQWQILKDNLRAGYTWINDRVFTPVKNAFRSVRDFFGNRVQDIKDQWQSMRDRLRSIYEWIRDRVFKPLQDFIKNKVVKSFREGVERIESAWDRIKSFAKKPIKFVIDTVINKGLIGAFNFVARLIPGVDELDKVKIAGFKSGGYTGHGPVDKAAGVVHAGEYVFTKRATSAFRDQIGLSGLDYMNKTGRFPGYNSGGIVRPVKGGTVTSGFGAPRGRYPHAGIDFAVPIGTNVFAAMAGRIARASWNAITGRTGKGVFMDHDGGRNTYYGHLSRILVKVGETVEQGQRIALSGNTGRSTGPHLHFETWSGGKPVNPAPYLSGAALPEGAEGGGFFNPLQGLLDLASGLVKKFTDKFPEGGHFLDIVSGTAKKLIDDATGWISDKVSAIGDWASDTWSDVKDTAATGAAKAQVRGVATLRGWGHGNQWSALNELIQRESSWNQSAANPRSSARGLFQKMTSLHGPVEKTAAGQARWGLRYIAERYGNPVNALAFHNRNNHYSKGGLVKSLLMDRGGTLPRGLSLIMNKKRHDETILPKTPREVEAMFTSQRSRSGERHYHYHAGRDSSTVGDFARDIDFHTRRLERSS